MNPGYATSDQHTQTRLRISFEEATARIVAARTFAELIDATGIGIEKRTATGTAYVNVRHAYRALAKIVHPDAAGPGRMVRATEAFAKLGALYAESDVDRVVHPKATDPRQRDGRKAQQHNWTGRRQTARDRVRANPDPVAEPPARTHPEYGTKTRPGEHGAKSQPRPAVKPWSRFDRLFATGDVADLFEDGDMLIKVPRDPADSDLIATESAALRRLRSHGLPTYQAYAPRLVDSFTHVDGGRHRRTVNVLPRQHGFRNLAEAGGLEPADLVWIWRRLLAGLGWAHRAGVVHGAVFEEHVLINPRPRGLVLVDWCYSAGVGRRPKALIAQREPEYPPEVPAGRPITAATDIYLATRLMTRLFGPGMPHPLRRFADGCLYDEPRMRPQNAWQLLAEFDELIPPQYRI